MSLKMNNLYGQFLTRYRKVQSFLKLQRRKPEQNRIKCAWQVAECFGKGGYLAQKIVTWERQWVTSHYIEDGNQGCHPKSYSWFNNEGVQLSVQDHIWSSGEKLTARDIAKVVGEYLKSNWARNAVAKILGSEIAFQLDELAEIPANLRIRSRIAQNWLKHMGFSYNRVTKGIYIYGHERADVVEYWDQVFLLQWAKLSKRMVIFSEDGSWKHPPNLSENE